jgi:hypothetical protein
MPTVKEEVRELLDRLPDDATIQDIQHHLAAWATGGAHHLPARQDQSADAAPGGEGIWRRLSSTRGPRTVDKQSLIEVLDGVAAELGIEFDPSATAEQAREAMIRDGIDPNGREFSQEIIRAREER